VERHAGDGGADECPPTVRLVAEPEPLPDGGARARGCTSVQRPPAKRSASDFVLDYMRTSFADADGVPPVSRGIGASTPHAALHHAITYAELKTSRLIGRVRRSGTSGADVNAG
jgi:hypothetical protein